VYIGYREDCVDDTRDPEVPSLHVHDINDTDTEIHYFKDPSTDLCYALIRGGNKDYYFSGVVPVPCNKIPGVDVGGSEEKE
jgi:hypothetical protein